MTKFAKEFPDYPAADMPPLPPGFEDSSWHNNACPSYSAEDGSLTIFIDYVDVAKREEPHVGCRFIMIDEDLDDVASGDDWNEMLAAIAAHGAKRSG